jgi:hypothetical protein
MHSPEEPCETSLHLESIAEGRGCLPFAKSKSSQI